MSELATTEQVSLLKRFSARYGVKADKMLSALKTTAFKQRGTAEISDEQMIALLIVADQHKLNPFTKEIYAYPDRGGIVPIVGVDGWARIINEHPQFDGMDFSQSDTNIRIDEQAQECPEWMECTIYRKDRSHPVKIREYLNEVYRPAFVKDGVPIKGPWQTHTKRFLRHKTMIQCSRVAFSFAGIYDPDEGERILDARVIEGELLPQRTALQEAIERHKDTIELIKQGIAENDLVKAVEAWLELTNEEQMSIWAAPRNGGPFTTAERQKIKSDEWAAVVRDYFAEPGKVVVESSANAASQQ